MKTLRYLAAFSLSLAVPALAVSHDAGNDSAHYSSAKKRSSPLVDKVRRATSRFRDINIALAEEWVPGTPCVSGPNSGAMGVHFVLPDRLGDGKLNAEEPEALIYEPLSNGAMRLVGVEFIVIANTWKGPGAPSLEGHLMNYVGEPNRYGLPAFYELHVWAWEHNPNGNFADWNSEVTCDKQPAE
jgi:hypothetical protein